MASTFDTGSLYTAFDALPRLKDGRLDFEAFDYVDLLNFQDAADRGMVGTRELDAYQDFQEEARANEARRTYKSPLQSFDDYVGY